LPTLNGTTRASALWLPLRASFRMIATRLRRYEQSDGSGDASAEPLPKLLAMPLQMKRLGRR
jgi:hypothetical protein